LVHGAAFSVMRWMNDRKTVCRSTPAIIERHVPERSRRGTNFHSREIFSAVHLACFLPQPPMFTAFCRLMLIKKLADSVGIDLAAPPIDEHAAS
jgi:hypothetical protein